MKNWIRGVLLAVGLAFLGMTFAPIGTFFTGLAFRPFEDDPAQTYYSKLTILAILTAPVGGVYGLVWGFVFGALVQDPEQRSRSARMAIGLFVGLILAFAAWVAFTF